ncbi:MAG: acyltransferase [Cyclobacteriaceae bacterium]
MGVDMFFALSGFLITTLLLEENRKKMDISLKGFYIRIALRLFPALYITLFFVLIYSIWLVVDENRRVIFLEVISSSLYLNNISWKWGWGEEGLLLGHTWSLAAEEQFYLVWPLVLICSLRLRSLLVLGFGLISFILVILFLKLSGKLPILAGSVFHESIFIGCLAALFRWLWKIHFNIPGYLTLICLLLIIIVGIFPVPGYQEFFRQGGRSVVALATVFVILGLINHPSGFTIKILSSRILVGIGKISYSLYLWHVPVFRWFKWHASLQPSVAFLMKFLVTFLLAWLSWILVEKRAVKLGRRITKKG